MLVTIAIAIAERSLSLRQLPMTAGISLIATVGITNLVLIGIELAKSASGTIVLLVVPAAIAVAALRAFAAQARRHEHLEFLYESMKATQGAPEFSLAVGQLLLTVRQLVRAEYAEIFLFPAGTESGLRSVLGRSDGMTAQSGPARRLRQPGRSSCSRKASARSSCRQLVRHTSSTPTCLRGF